MAVVALVFQMVAEFHLLICLGQKPVSSCHSQAVVAGFPGAVTAVRQRYDLAVKTLVGGSQQIALA